MLLAKSLVILISKEFNGGLNMNDSRTDSELNINTTGLIDWPRGVNLDYFRTESTSYKDLDRFMHYYDLLDDAKLVDYGSGKGRIVFYFNYVLGIPTAGLEVNQVAFSHFQQNYIDYQSKFPKKAEEVSLHEVKAEQYHVKPDENTFYFFNPFTVKIFEQVIERIEYSLKEHPRVADVILYYPGFDYTLYMDKYSQFDLVQTIKTPMYYINNRECFKVFRYFPEKK